MGAYATAVRYRGTVRSHSNMLYRIPYHTFVVWNIKNPTKKVPYHTRAAMVIRSCK